MKARFGWEQHYHGEGCPSCHYTGYSRRMAVYEVIPMQSALADKIKRRDLEVEDFLRESGIRTLRDQVADLVATGKTSLREAMTYLVE